MNDFIILGTDTDVGKTTFALLWLSAFADQWEYWKPVETGDSLLMLGSSDAAERRNRISSFDAIGSVCGRCRRDR